MNRDDAFAILSERYPPGALEAAKDRLRDKEKLLRPLELRIENAEGLLDDIDACLKQAAATQISEFIEGERPRQYDDLCRLRHQLSRLTSEIEAEQEYIRRHVRVTEMMRGR